MKNWIKAMLSVVLLLCSAIVVALIISLQHSSPMETFVVSNGALLPYQPQQTHETTQTVGVPSISVSSSPQIKHIAPRKLIVKQQPNHEKMLVCRSPNQEGVSRCEWQ